MIVDLIVARESCAGAFRTLPEESINGDSIEVVRQEGAPEDHGCFEGAVDAWQKRRQDIARSEAKELEEGHRAIRCSAEILRKADALCREAVASDAYQARCDDRATAGSDCREAGRSGRRGAGRKREGSRHDLTAALQRTDGTGRLRPSRLSSRYSRTLGEMRCARKLARAPDVRL